jgi:hypothetical protein
MDVKDIKIEFLTHKVNNFFDLNVLEQKNVNKKFSSVDEKNKKIYLEIKIIHNVDQIKIHVYGKKNKDTILNNEGKIIDDTYIKIENIWFDNIKLNLHFLESFVTFKPTYSEQEILFINQNNIEFNNKMYQHNCKFYYNGELTFKIGKNFYWNYNKVLCSNLTKNDNRLKYTDLGMHEDKDLEELNRMFNELSK